MKDRKPKPQGSEGEGDIFFWQHLAYNWLEDQSFPEKMPEGFKPLTSRTHFGNNSSLNYI